MDRHHRRSQRQEKRNAKERADIGGQVTKGSGCGEYDKADVRDDYFLSENKTTEKKSYSLKKTEWEKIRKQALDKDRIPIMDIEIVGTDELVVVRKTDFNWMVEQIDWNKD